MSLESHNFGPVLTNTFGEAYLPSVNQEIFSVSGSESFFSSHFGECFDRKDSLFIIVGTDSGLLVKWLLKKGMGEGSRYLFVEFPTLLQRLEEEGLIPGDLPSHLVITTPEMWLEQAQAMSLKSYCYLGNVQQIPALVVVDAFFDEYTTLWNGFQEAIGQFQIQVGHETGSRVFMMKGLENLAENRVPAPCLCDIFTGRTGVLLAGGPSLRESFPWVKANREHLTVFAVSRIAQQLQQEGIVPDLVFAIDPHDIIFHQSKDMLTLGEHTVLVNVYHLNPRLLSQWRGRSVFMGVLFPWDTELNQTNFTFPGITVGHQALGMGIEMGFSQIVLAGFDLCFDKSGFTHAEGSVERNIGPYTAPSELKVETNGGWQAETRYDFLNAIPSLALLASQAQERGCQIINPAAGAVRIEPIAHRPWDEIELKTGPEPTTESAWQTIQAALPEDSAQTRNQHFSAVEAELVRVRSEVRTIIRLTTEAMDCNERFFGRKGKAPNFKFKKRMDEIESILDEAHKPITDLVKKWGMRDFLKLSRPDADREWSDDDIEKAGHRYYEIYKESATALIRLLDDVRQRLRCRQEEEKPRPKLKMLMAQWQRDQQYGRAFILQQRRGEDLQSLGSQASELLAEMATEFDRVMTETDHDYRKHCQVAQATPQAIRSKAMVFFKTKDAERLRLFWEGLTETESEGKDQYGLFIKGLMAELEGNPQGALRSYRQVTHALLMTDCMKRNLSICLQQGDLVSARAVAERLAKRSPLHIPYYADLLRLSGERERAVTVYTDYVKIVKNDFVTIQKLGKLHQEMGDIEAARAVFQGILDRDSENRGAKQLLAGLEAG